MKFAGTYFSRRIQIPLSVPCSRSHLGRAPTTGGNEHTKRPLAGSCQRWSKCPPRSRVRLTDAPYGETTPRRVHVETHLSKGKKKRSPSASATGPTSTAGVNYCPFVRNGASYLRRSGLTLIIGGYHHAHPEACRRWHPALTFQLGQHAVSSGVSAYLT